MNFNNKKIAVLGAGVEGLSSAAWLKKHGAKVTVLDKKQGEHYLNGLDQYEMIVRSPGVRLNLPEIEAARKAGVTITSQTKLFFDLSPAKIIGVTGTKGKGTTSSLIFEMLKKEGKDLPAGRQGAYLGGNIGQPPFEFLDTLTDLSWVVLELSSFQLQDLHKSPNIAVMLMVTSEHLDYHKDTLEYVAAKRNILKHQSASDFAILNRDYPATNESDIHTNAQVYYVSREREVPQGAYVRDGKVILRVPRVPQVSQVPRGDQKARDTFVVATNDMLLPGRHNWENVCAAVAAASLAGVRMGSIVQVLKTFKGLEHRLELVREVGGVRFYDDSFSTTPETAIAAIEAFTEPEILILGGSSKGSDFRQLGRVIRDAKNIKAIIGIGIEWERMKKQFQISNFPLREASKFQIPIIEGAKDMNTIVLAASKIAEPGDVVLLSPACASFDMFTNYKDRGNQFKHEVAKLGS